MAIGTENRVEEIAQELFSAFTQIGLSTMRSRRRKGDLKEIEFLTLSLLQEHGTMIVGDIQRLLGVLPAQMSRIIRSLESRERPLISCQINPRDKRKINVALSEDGDFALASYQQSRLSPIVDGLSKLSDEDQDDLARLVQKLTVVLENGHGD